MSGSSTRAARVVEELAERLADPEAVAAAAVDDSRGESVPPWFPHSLSHGHAGIAVLHAELGHTRRRFRAIAHEHLRRAVGDTGGTSFRGAFDGVGAAASAARVASGHGDYGSILDRLDEHLIARSERLATAQELEAGSAEPVAFETIDVVVGLSGIGRYLLHRREKSGDPRDTALRAALRALTTLRHPRTVEGTSVPGWWYDASSSLVEGPEFAHGHANLGLAHGVSGPLALLSVAWRDGVRVPDQAETIRYVAEWLVHHRLQDRAGPYWPPHLGLGHYTDPGAHPVPAANRPSWCYGAPGIARALDLAGQALGVERWRGLAVEAVRAVTRRPLEEWGIVDSGLCHGWASALYLLLLFEIRHPEAGLGPVVDETAHQLLERFDSTAPFGYRNTRTTNQVPDPGLLEGAAGIALALHAYATRSLPASGWDTLLLLD
ncbi:hypothetical protein J2S53_001280 [Actinopolyspora lacussalsi]|nr:hypothetical protein [Actinopolyspora lacussalsi]